MARYDADLELAVDDAALDRVDRRHMQVQGDIRRTFAEQRDSRANVRGRVTGGLVEYRHIELATHAPVDFVHTGAECVGGRQQTQGLGVDLLAFNGQREAGTAAPAQGEAQADFQVLDMAADGGRTNIEFQFGCRHAAAVHYGLEDPQQAQVHVA